MGGHTGAVALLGFSPEGQRIVTAGVDGTARVWDVLSGRCVHTLDGHSDAVWCAAFSPDGTTIATGSKDGLVRLWDARSGALIKPVAAYSGTVMCLAFRPDGRQLAFGGGSGNTWIRSTDNRVGIVDLATGESRLLTGHTHCVSGIAFHPDGRRLATASWDGTARLGDLQSDGELEPLFQVSGPGALLTVAFSPDGNLCAVGGGAMELHKADAGVHLIDVATRRVVQVLEGHARMVRDVAFSPDGSQIASTGLDGTLKVWPVAAPPEFLSLEGHDQAVWTVAVSPDGRRAATGSLDQTARIWDLESGRLVGTVRVGFPVVSLAFSADGNRLLTVAGHATAKLWRLVGHGPASPSPASEPVMVLEGHGDTVLCVAASSCGRYFATGGRDRTARIWDARSGRLVRVLEGHTNRVLSVSFRADGEQLATAGADGTARIWQVATGQPLWVLGEHPNEVLQVAWSPDGRWIATGAQDGKVRLWDGRTGTPTQTPGEGHRDGVSSLAFSPDGRRLASAAGGLGIVKTHNLDNSVFLWDLATGQTVLRLRPHFNVVRAVAIGTDGTSLVTGSVDNTARIYRAFAWQTADDSEQGGLSPEERLEHDKRAYWSRWSAITSRLPSPLPGRIWVTNIYPYNVTADARPKTRPARPVPARDATAAFGDIDLSPVYNAALDEAWIPAASLDDLDLDLSALPVGRQAVRGVGFDIRGVIQLGRPAPDWSRFPTQVSIPVNGRCQRIHVLQGVVSGELEGAVVGKYRLHYADNQTAELDIRYGRDLRDWRENGAPRSLGESSMVAWTGPRWANAPPGETLRLFKTAYQNPRPDTDIVGLEFVSTLTHAAPFLVAMTIE
jgi:WD40 repeat protein